MNRPTLNRALSLSLLIATAGLGGCSSYAIDQETGGEDESSTDTGSTGGSTGGETGESSDSATAGASGTSGGSSASDGTGASTDPTGGDSGEPGGSSGSDDSGDPDSDSGEPLEPGQLTAGEWRDLDHWDFWSKLLEAPEWSSYESAWNFFTAERYAVIVESNGAQIADAQVTLLAGEAPVWEARTDVRGRAELVAGLFGDSVEGPLTIAVNGAPMIAEATPAAADPIVVQIEDAAAPEPVLDLLFMIDTTGSMGDELEYLQAELADVIDEVRTEVGQSFKLRLSVNFYRDEGDAYVVRAFPFTEDVDLALSDLAAQGYDGGGDYPEAVTEALESAISGHEWSESAVSRLAFLVLDAPPHETANNIASMNSRIEEAAAKGIRIIPVASSGVDKTTEFFLRFIDIATGGTYVFLTRDSGIGGEHLEPTIGEYKVELLNDLLVRVISEAVGVK